jgi:polyhydroxybutyrate depolymerase
MIFLTLLALSALGQDAVKPGASDGTLNHADHERTYRLYIPKSYKGEPLPLVVALHGASSNGIQTERLTGLDKLADDKGFAVVYPDGLDNVWRYTEFMDRKGIDDLGFVVALVDKLVKDKVADPRRVYATGISNGAYMSNMLAARYSEKFAAIAPVAGTFLRFDKPKPSRPVPVMYFHGTDDKFVGYDGTDFISHRKFSMSAEELVTWWAEQDGCDAVKDPKIEKIPHNDDGPSVQRCSYGTSKSGAEVVFYRIEGGGHSWPGGSKMQEALLGKVTHDIDASALMWEFFSKYSLPSEEPKK